MTAAEAAAALAGAKANTSGVFSLDQLKALGQTGDMATDWTKSAAPGGLIAGGGNAVLTATGLKAGYYQLPGAAGAEYYDPASGQASQAFVDWANALTPDQRDPFTGQPSNFIPAEGGPEATSAARFDQSAQGIAAVNAIIAGGKGTDGTYQASMDRYLGTGVNQQFMLGANGEQLRVGTPLAPKPLYQDVSPGKSGMFKLVAPPGGTGQSQWQDASGAAVLYSEVAADTQAQVDALNAKNQGAWQGLQAERVARGEDPNTGISAVETKQIYDTYQRIQDPAERAAFIRAQDPGNLTAGLRVARTAARQGEANWMTKNQLAPTVTYESAVKYGAPDGSGAGVKTTFGDITQTDAATGRSIMFGNVPVKREFVAPQDNGLALSIGGHKYLNQMDVHRINGGVQMFMGALITGGILGMSAGILAATSVVAGYAGAGAFLPNSRNISFKNASGWTDWKSGDPQQLTPTGFLLGLGIGGLMNGVSSFAGKYFSSAATQTAVKAAPSFAAKFGMPALLGGLQLESTAKGRQAQQDFIQARQRTGG